MTRAKTRKPIPKFDKQKALAEAEDAKTWSCSDCGAPTDEGCSQCTTCLQYKVDVENGMFDYFNEWKNIDDDLTEQRRLELEEACYFSHEPLWYDEIDNGYYNG